jgi:hypothetical protein
MPMARHTLSFASVQRLTLNRLHHVNTREESGSSDRAGRHPDTGDV